MVFHGLWSRRSLAAATTLALAVTANLADATATYNLAEIAPSVASNLTMQQIAAILNETGPNPPYLVKYALTATEANDNTIGFIHDPLTITPEPGSLAPLATGLLAGVARRRRKAT